MTKLQALDAWLAGKPTGEPELRKPPGQMLLAIVSAAVAVWICLQRNLWPSPFGKFAWLDPLLVTLAMILVFVAVGLFWAIRTLYVLLADRRWSWWILPAPIVVCVGVTALAVLPPQSMLDERAGFETVASDLLRVTPETTRQDFEIGPFDIGFAQTTPDGEVYFHDEGAVCYSPRWDGCTHPLVNRPDSMTSPQHIWTAPGANSEPHGAIESQRM